MKTRTIVFNFLFLLLLNTTVISQISSPLSVNIEIALQTFNATNTTVDFQLYPISSKAYAWEDECIYSEVTKYYSDVSITGNYTGLLKGYSIAHYGESSVDGTMRLALNEITITINDEELSFVLYDNRDCHYYTSCDDGFSQDITLRVDASNGGIWMYEGHTQTTSNPSTSTGWEVVTDETINIWEVRGWTHCPLDFSGAPDNPTNLSVSGGVGDSPTLSWTANTEPDLNGYKIYQKIGNNSYGYLTVVNDTATGYTDNNVTITGGKFDPSVYYKITAIDTEELESGYSNEVFVKSNTINKNVEQQDQLQNQLNYSLSEAFPNPFNPQTKIFYSIAKDGIVVIKVYDTMGNDIALLVNDFKSKGEYSVNFNASDLPSGIYFYNLSSGSYFNTKKMMLIK